MTQARAITAFKSKTALVDDLNDLTVEKFTQNPLIMLNALHDFISQFESNLPENIRLMIKEKINAFESNSKSLDIKRYLELLVAMVVERTRPFEKVLEVYKGIQERHPNFLHAFNYHAKFLFKQQKYADCIALLSTVLARRDIHDKKRREEAREILRKAREELTHVTAAVNAKNSQTEVKQVAKNERTRVPAQHARSSVPKPKRISAEEKLRRQKLAAKRHARRMFFEEQAKQLAAEEAKNEAERNRIRIWNETQKAANEAKQNAAIAYSHRNRFGLLTRNPSLEQTAAEVASSRINSFRK